MDFSGFFRSILTDKEGDNAKMKITKINDFLKQFNFCF